MDLRDITEFFRDAFKYIVVIIIVLLVAIFVFTFQQVLGPSMENTLYEGDVLIVDKLRYRFSKIRRGDIVVVNVNEKYMVKRVIGLPGETVEFKDNSLIIDGTRYSEKYVKEDTKDFSVTKFGVDKIPDGKYLVLGDNRNDSQDSRYYGFVDKSKIVGQVKLRIFPFTKISIIK